MWEFVDQCVYEHTGECIITINGDLQGRSQMPRLKVHFLNTMEY